MELSLQTVLVNVTDLDRSLRFYREVLGLALVSRRDQAAALMVSESRAAARS
jgi:catechol 2,3-dioxygenase-like lactoylglutathione lyase family enzyme